MAKTFTTTRSILIDAPPEAILPQIADLKRHAVWSPFSKPDPKMTVDRYEGAPGVGQSRTFAGGASGAGRIAIDSVAPGRVLMTLAMTRPFRSTNTVDYALTPVAEGTRVSWTMSGPVTFASRILGLFVDCDAMCGKMFEQGLAELKALTERPAEPERLAA